MVELSSNQHRDGLHIDLAYPRFSHTVFGEADMTDTSTLQDTQTTKPKIGLWSKRILPAIKFLYAGAMLVFAGLGTWGFVQWILEADHRAQDREVAQTTLIESAYKALDDAQADRDTINLTPRLANALRTLSKYGEPIELAATTKIDLTGAELTCGHFTLRAPEIRLDGVTLNESTLVLDGQIVEMAMTSFNSTIRVVERFDGQRVNRLYVSGYASDTKVDIPSQHPWIDIAATNLTVTTQHSVLPLEGATGPIILDASDKMLWRLFEPAGERVQDIAIAVTAIPEELKGEIGLTTVTDYTNFAPGYSMGPSAFVDFRYGPGGGNKTPNAVEAATPDAASSDNLGRLPNAPTGPLAATAIFKRHGWSDAILTDEFLELCPLKQQGVDGEWRFVCPATVVVPRPEVTCDSL